MEINTLLNNQQVKEIEQKIKKYLETNKNGNTTYQNLCKAAKTALKGKFLAINAYIKKKGRSQINNLTLHLKQVEKEKQIKPKVSRRNEITKVRVKINETQTRKTIEKINKTKSWCFEKINKIDKPLARLRKKEKRLK